MNKQAKPSITRIPRSDLHLRQTSHSLYTDLHAEQKSVPDLHKQQSILKTTGKVILGAVVLTLAWKAVEYGFRKGDMADDIRLEEHAEQARLYQPPPGSLDLSDDIVGYYDSNDRLAYIKINDDLHVINSADWAKTPLGLVDDSLKSKYNFDKLTELIKRINADKVSNNSLTIFGGIEYTGIEGLVTNDVDLSQYKQRALFTNF
ncbi:hypothetical protein H6503_00395 [Candidatus Woesearchaeota archaeon]|nr:hypothetical protein [Candidatus Woesearchaeota archaeon]